MQKLSMRKHRDVKFVTTEARRNYLGSEANYHTATFLLYYHTAKLRINLSIIILELSEILMYEFWFDHVKPKYCETAKLCYVDTVSLYT